jgi:hypothetical protein
MTSWLNAKKLKKFQQVHVFMEDISKKTQNSLAGTTQKAASVVF